MKREKRRGVRVERQREGERSVRKRWKGRGRKEWEGEAERGGERVYCKNKRE